MARKIISLILSFGLLFQQTSLVYAVGELNLANYLSSMPRAIIQPDYFRPPQLRYISYDLKSNDFKLLLDKGGAKQPNDKLLTQELLNYFLIGLSLPNDTFWVNLRPDAADSIIDPLLEKTDIGRIFLEADLQLKKDTASMTSPQNPEGKVYWDKLYKKAGELFGTENITIPTITRPWIVPNEVIVRETDDSAYIYKATLKVMLEEDYLKSSRPSAFSNQQYNFNDPRLKELNQYSTQLIRETILPKLTQEVNSSQRYAKLRQVYYSLVLSRWFKMKYKGKPGQYPELIDRQNLTNLASKQAWDKQTYFSQYQESFANGEYNLKETVASVFGQSIRSYVSGGIVVGSPISEGVVKVPGLSVVTDKLVGDGNILFDEELRVIESIEQPVALAASPLVANTEIPELLEGWPIFESIEMLAQSTKQPVLSFDTDILIGEKVKKVYKRIKASSKYRYDPRKKISIKYWTIELLENAKSKDPVVQIQVNRLGNVSAMTPENLSPAERDKIVAVVKNKFFLDITEMPELKKKGVSSPLSIPEIKKAAADALTQTGKDLKWHMKNSISVEDINKLPDTPEALLEWLKKAIGVFKKIINDVGFYQGPNTVTNAKEIIAIYNGLIEKTKEAQDSMPGQSNVLDGSSVSPLSSPLTAELVELLEWVVKLDDDLESIMTGELEKIFTYQLSNMKEYAGKLFITENFYNKFKALKFEKGKKIFLTAAIREISEAKIEKPENLRILKEFLFTALHNYYLLRANVVLGYMTTDENITKKAGKVKQILESKVKPEYWFLETQEIVNTAVFSKGIVVPTFSSLIGKELSVVDINGRNLRYVNFWNLPEEKIESFLESFKSFKKYLIDGGVGIEAAAENLRFAASVNVDGEFYSVAGILEYHKETKGIIRIIVLRVDEKAEIKTALENAWKDEVNEEMRDLGISPPLSSPRSSPLSPQLIKSSANIAKANISRLKGELEKVGSLIDDDKQLLEEIDKLLNDESQNYLQSLRDAAEKLSGVYHKSIVVLLDQNVNNIYGEINKKLEKGYFSLMETVGAMDFLIMKAGGVASPLNAEALEAELVKLPKTEKQLSDLIKIFSKVDKNAQLGPQIAVLIATKSMMIPFPGESPNIYLMREAAMKSVTTFFSIKKLYSKDRFSIIEVLDKIKEGLLLEKLTNIPGRKISEETKKYIIALIDLYIEAVDNAKNDIEKQGAVSAGSPIGQAKAMSSSLKKQVGGIDFTDRAMRIKLERVGSFASLALVLPEIANVEAIDLDKEFKQIQAMVSSSIRPSDTRILEFAAACYYRGEFDRRLEQVSSCVKAAYLADELLGKDSSDTLRLATMLPDALYSYSLN